MSVVPFQWCLSFEIVFPCVMGKQGFMSRNRVKNDFFVGSETAFRKQYQRRREKKIAFGCKRAL